MKLRQKTWIGSFSGWDTTTEQLKVPSLQKHEEPFNKRRDGSDRRAARRHKQTQRDALLTGRERDDGWYAAG